MYRHKGAKFYACSFLYFLTGLSNAPSIVIVDLAEPIYKPVLRQSGRSVLIFRFSNNTVLLVCILDQRQEEATVTEILMLHLHVNVHYNIWGVISFSWLYSSLKLKRRTFTPSSSHIVHC